MHTNMVDVVCSTTDIVKCDRERVIAIVSHEYPYVAINKLNHYFCVLQTQPFQQAITKR